MVIIFMIIYHLLYDLKYMFGAYMPWFSAEKWYPFQQLICWSFIFLSGFSVNLSKNSFKNSIRIIICAYILTIITKIVTPDFAIYFGVLHLIGFSMLLVSFINKKIDYSLLYTLLSFSIFFIFWKIGLERFSIFYKLREYNLYPLGFYKMGFSSSDYFPLIPWFFLFLTGYFIGNYHKYKNKFFRKIEINSGIIGKIGQKSLLLYMAHQPIIYGVLLIFKNLKLI